MMLPLSIGTRLIHQNTIIRKAIDRTTLHFRLKAAKIQPICTLRLFLKT